MARRRLARVAEHLRPCTAAATVEDPHTGLLLRSDSAEDRRFHAYVVEGERRAREMTNRGPLRLDRDGKVHPDIIAEYDRTGFYVLESVVSHHEIEEVRAEFEEILANAPSQKGSAEDSRGRPVRFPQLYSFSSPLTDPAGGGPSGVHKIAFPGDDPAITAEIVGRHQMKMREPKLPPRSDVPRKVLNQFSGPMAYMDSLVRAFGHPGLLTVAEAINGEDFVPFTETMWYKAPFAASTAWHQDPSSSWDDEWRQPDFDVHKLGFSFHLSLYDATAVNSLWMIPGSQFMGRIDIAALSASGDGSDRLPGAVPILMKPGDCFIQSRTALHGAFPNMSNQPRCTFQFGFNKRKTVSGLTTRGYGYQGRLVTYDDAYLHHRSKMIQWAIDARAQRYPDEQPYVYKPLEAEADSLRWDPRLRDDPETMRVIDSTMPVVV
jgi:ectoine hydroxylase-related dioxygenase (phytanoyl-CoA dioxygenase family)